MKILFIGNSYTYFNEMPAIFCALATENGYEVQVDAVTKGGRRLYENLAPEDEYHKKIAALLEQNEYDVLILQEQSFFALVDYAQFANGIKGLIEWVGAKRNVLYATWGRHEGCPLLEEHGWTTESMTDLLAKAYEKAALECGAEVSPVGRCFARVRALEPSLELYTPDLSHPSHLGSCVAAVMHYRTVFGVLPDACTALKSDSDTVGVIKSAVNTVAVLTEEPKGQKPVIGIVGAIGLNDQTYLLQNYVRALEHAGAAVVLLPYTKSISSMQWFAKACNGFLFAGGVDIAPWRYGEEKMEQCGEITPLRDEFELSVFDLLFQTDKPILGICRGCQLINVALGGTLVQDIPTQCCSTLTHRQGLPHHLPVHGVSIEKNSALYALLGQARIAVNSLHHQAVKELGRGLCSMAQADDGVIEAFCSAEHGFLWGIQWHPERSVETDENSRKLFDAFVAACKLINQ